RAGHLHTTGLTTPAGLHLRLHHHTRGPGGREVLRDRPRLLRRRSDPAGGDRDAVLREELLRLMFEQVHGGPSLTGSTDYDRAQRSAPTRQPSPPGTR